MYDREQYKEGKFVLEEAMLCKAVGHALLIICPLPSL